MEEVSDPAPLGLGVGCKNSEALNPKPQTPSRTIGPVEGSLKGSCTLSFN